MYYIVTARLVRLHAAEFYRRLTDGSVASQRPDGTEIVASMKRAKILPDGRVRWSEQCFCRTPLAHERATVFDEQCEALETEVIEAYQDYDGRSFLEYLAELVEVK